MENDYKLILKKKKAALENLPVVELLAYRNAIDIVTQYYDNLAKANSGEYDDFKKKEYAEALKEVNKYKDLSTVVFDVIKNKVDNI